MWRLGRRVHVSWFIGWLAFAIVVGIFFVPHLTFMSVNSIGLCIGVACIAVAMCIRRRWLIVLLIIGGLLVGLWRGEVAMVDSERYDSLVGTQIIVTGAVEEDPVKGDNDTRLIISSVKISSRSYPGNLYVTTTDDKVVKRGDTVTLRGELSEAFGSYNGTLYRAQVLDVVFTHDAIVDFRDWFAGLIRKAIDEPAASLGLGFLVGEKSSLPSDLTDALQVAGLTHVVVASGYNLTILVRLGRRLFMRVSKFTATLVSLLMILGFIGVTGMSPSMTRAGAVALLSLAAWYYGRRFHPFVLLSIVAAFSVLLKPNYVWNDVGWALSFAAFIGVMIMAPLLQRYFFGDRKPGVIRQIFGETVAAHIMTAPLIVMVFSQVSHVAIISNMLVLPLVPLAMLLTFVTGILAAIFLPLAEGFGWITQQLLEYMTGVIYYTADLSWAKSDVSLSVWWIVGAYCVVAGVLVYLWRRTRLDLREANIVE